MYTRTKESLTIAPAVEPVSVEEAARHCREFTHDQDEYLSGLIVAARKRLENVCWSSFITQTWQYWWDQFYPQLFIPRPPLRYGITSQSVTAFQYVASGTTTPTYTTVPSTAWEISAENERPYIRPAYLQSWPSTRGYRDDVTMTVKSGYGDRSTDVPEPIRHAIKLYVGFMYLNRGDEPAEFPQAVWDLLADYRFKEF